MQIQNTEACKEHPNKIALFSSVKHHRIRCLTLLSALLLVAFAVVVLAEEPAGKDLRLFYQQNCVHCHGLDGSAVSPEGKKLKGQDLTDEHWRQRTKDDKMVHTILNGKFFGIAMPRFKNILSRDEAQQMVTDIIRKSKKGEAIGPETMEPGEKQPEQKAVNVR